MSDYRKYFETAKLHQIKVQLTLSSTMNILYRYVVNLVNILNDLGNLDVHFFQIFNFLRIMQQKLNSSYFVLLQETSTELTELETSIQGKTSLVEKLQEEILSMVVKKEMLSKQIEEVNASHSDKHQALIQQSSGMVF